MFSSVDAFYLKGFPFVLGVFCFYSNISISLLDFIIEVFIIFLPFFVFPSVSQTFFSLCYFLDFIELFVYSLNSLNSLTKFMIVLLDSGSWGSPR